MIFSVALALANPFPADVERIPCREMDGYVWERELNEDASRRRDLFPETGNTYFFPNGALNGFLCGWYSGVYASLEEEPLALGNAQSRLRYVIIPSFTPPLSITVTAFEDGTGRIEARSTDGAGGYDPGKLIYNEVGTLSIDDMARIRREIAAANLCSSTATDENGYKVPSADPNNDVATIAVTADGSQRVFELITDERYCLRDAVARPNDEMSKLHFWLLETFDTIAMEGGMRPVKQASN